MKQTTFLLIFFLFAGIIAKSQPNTAVKLDPVLHYDDHIYDVSIIHLLANPEKFAGKRVRIQGYFVLEFEGVALYLHQEDYNEAIFQNSLWVNLDDTSAKDAGKCSKHYAMIEATFNPADKGHMDVFGGALTHVESIKIWPPKSNRP
jgi:hypothetical protein